MPKAIKVTNPYDWDTHNKERIYRVFIAKDDAGALVRWLSVDPADPDHLFFQTMAENPDQACSQFEATCVHAEKQLGDKQ